MQVLYFSSKKIWKENLSNEPDCSGFDDQRAAPRCASKHCAMNADCLEPHRVGSYQYWWMKHDTQTMLTFIMACKHFLVATTDQETCTRNLIFQSIEWVESSTGNSLVYPNRRKQSRKGSLPLCSGKWQHNTVHTSVIIHFFLNSSCPEDGMRI